MPVKKGNKRILIVDDDRDMSIFLSSLLGARGYKAVVTENRLEGLTLAKESSPACIVINIMISGEEGIYLYSDLKRDSVLRSIPVLLLSTIPIKSFYHYLDLHNNGTNQPAPDAFLVTPSETGDFIEVVNSLVSREKG